MVFFSKVFMFKRTCALLFVVAAISLSCSKNITEPIKTAPPVITTQPQSATAVAGNAWTFSVVATGNPVPTYQWQRSNDGGTTWADIGHATDSSYSYNIASVTINDSGVYRVVVSNSLGTVNSNPATLTVHFPPIISLPPLSATVFVDSSVSFTVAASGNPAPGCQWQKNGSDISGANSTTYTIHVASFADSGSYTVVVTNSVRSDTSNAAILTVRCVPPTLLSPDSSETVASVTPTLAWNASPGATSYMVVVSDSSDLAGATEYFSSASNAVITGLADGATYYWAVVAQDADLNDISTYSSVWSFTTAL